MLSWCLSTDNIVSVAILYSAGSTLLPVSLEFLFPLQRPVSGSRSVLAMANVDGWVEVALEGAVFPDEVPAENYCALRKLQDELRYEKKLEKNDKIEQPDGKQETQDDEDSHGLVAARTLSIENRLQKQLDIDVEKKKLDVQGAPSSSSSSSMVWNHPPRPTDWGGPPVPPMMPAFVKRSAGMVPEYFDLCTPLSSRCSSTRGSQGGIPQPWVEMGGFIGV